jgi:6-phosphogluconolactonase
VSGEETAATVELLVAESAEEAAARAAELLVQAARTGGELALAGGSTPRRAYELAAALEPDWGAAGLWFGDERCVPPDDERSNFRLVSESLLERLARRPTVHRVRCELGPARAAAAYELELASSTLDLALLGIGADGHTASLFPCAPSLGERERRVVAAAPGLEPYVERVTLTVPALAAAAEVVFLAVGADKAEAVERAFARAPDRRTPASLVRSASGRTRAVLDRAAAALLPGHGRAGPVPRR